MKVLLSGYNLDIETLNDLKSFIHRVAEKLNSKSFSELTQSDKSQLLDNLYQEAVTLLERDNLTPETLSAAYARISRNPKPINELRKIARQEVSRARKSNRNIIFGLGHKSVAEHAVFNFDILDVSRLAVETIEHFRLASFTEKSQRYILFKNDFFIPQEIKKTPLEKEYKNLIKEQNRAYHSLYKILRSHFFRKYYALAKDQKNHNQLEGLAKEDARYVISLATQTQLGITVNARSLENIIAKCNSHYLTEIREYGNQLYSVTKSIAPSIIKYVEPTPFLFSKSAMINNFFKGKLVSYTNNNIEDNEEVQLLDWSENADDAILAILFFHYTNTNYNDSLKKTSSLKYNEKKKLFSNILRDIQPWDSVLRDFEFVYFTFQLIVSSSNFGQLKRHRIVNIIPQDYDVNLGVTIPDSIIESKQQSLFMKIIKKTNAFYNLLMQENPNLAPYVLTNSHRRRVLLKVNLRELYHFFRLREDENAQWDIRRTAIKMHNLIRNKLPLSGCLIGGKDKFKQFYNDFYND
ncbi:MAG: FAD-dependent thymidylate synthase [Promethearchaeota archaeon]